MKAKMKALILSTLIPLSGMSFAEDLHHIQRIAQTVHTADSTVDVAFYSDYSQSHNVVLNNMTSNPVRYVSTSGFVADIAAQSNFAVPCSSDLFNSGQLRVPSDDGYQAVFQDIYCNDYITIEEGEDNE